MSKRALRLIISKNHLQTGAVLHLIDSSEPLPDDFLEIDLDLSNAAEFVSAEDPLLNTPRDL